MRAAPCIAAVTASVLFATHASAVADEPPHSPPGMSLGPLSLASGPVILGIGATHEAAGMPGPLPTVSDAGPAMAGFPGLSFYGLQASSIVGDVWLEGRYLDARLAPPAGPRGPTGHGWQIRARWLLNPETAQAPPVRSRRGERPGWGLWELEAGYLDVDSGPLAALAGRKLSLGLNWYMGPGLRVKASYSRMKNPLAEHDLPGEPTRPRVLQLRMQAEF